MKHELQLSDLNPNLQTSKEMSSRYVWMDTTEIVNNLLSLKSKGEEVFELRSIQGKKTRKANMVGRGIHLVRIRMKKSYEIDGDTMFPELVIKNSYDGSCPLIVEMGVFRLVCTNGLIVKSKDFGSLKIRHTGTAWDAVFDMVKGMAAALPKMIDMQQKIAAVKLTDIQITEFARKAVNIRWNKVAENADFEMVTEVIRPEDEGNSLWKVFNVVQEKLMLGGIKLDGMKRTGRKVANAAEDLRINQELFELAMEYVNSNEGVVDVLETV